MKRVLFLLLLVACSPQVYAQECKVIVSGGQYQPSKFGEKCLLWTDRKYVAENTPREFEGYDMLLSRFVLGARGERSAGGIMAASCDCDAYVIAGISYKMRTTLADGGWSLLDGTVFDYRTADRLALAGIYARRLRAGEVVTLPLVGDMVGIIPLAEHIEYHRPPAEMSDVKISLISDTDCYVKRILADGVEPWTNRKYTLQGVPQGFAGAEILATAALGRSEKSPYAVFRAESAGEVYVLARPTNAVKGMLKREGWTMVEGTEFEYRTADGAEKIAIFSKKMRAGGKAYMPEVRDFGGAIPLAVNIDYKFRK